MKDYLLEGYQRNTGRPPVQSSRLVDIVFNWGYESRSEWPCNYEWVNGSGDYLIAYWRYSSDAPAEAVKETSNEKIAKAYNIITGQGISVKNVMLIKNLILNV